LPFEKGKKYFIGLENDLKIFDISKWHTFLAFQSGKSFAISNVKNLSHGRKTSS